VPLNRRTFLFLGTSLCVGSFGLSREAHGAESFTLQIDQPLSPQDTGINNIPFSTVIPGRHSGFMVQSDYGGAENNFEAVFPSLYQGLAQVYRDNAAPGFPWIGPLPPDYTFECNPLLQNSLHGSYFGSGEASDVSLIQSDFVDSNSPHGHLELIVRYGDRLALYWRASEAPFLWSGPLFIPSTEPHTGNPALVQADFGVIGNFELVVPHAESGLVHYVRLNDNPELPWFGPTRFAEELGLVDAVAMIQSDYINDGESNGHMELIARVGNQLYYLWRESKPPSTWTLIPTPITNNFGTELNVAGVPGFIQSQNRNFQVVTPLASGGMAHLCRLNNGQVQWDLASVFGEELGPIEAVSLLQSSFENGNLEILVRTTNQPNQFINFYNSGGGWLQGGQFTETVEGDALNQGEWSVPYTLEFGTVGIHAAVLHTGKVLLVGYDDTEENENSTVSVLNPKTGQQVNVLPDPQYNKFCSGHAFLPDGRLVVASGNVEPRSAKSLHTFTPEGEGGFWTDFGPMSGDIRWYPTCTTLPDGRVSILAGTAEVFTTINQVTCSADYTSGSSQPRPVNKTYEIFDGTIKGPSIPVPEIFDTCQESLGLYGLYPFVFVLPDGKLFIHGNTRTYLLDVETNAVETLPFTTQLKTSRTYPSEGSAVLLPLLPEENYQAKVMVIGGGVSCAFSTEAEISNCGLGQSIDPDSGNPITSQCPDDTRDDWKATKTCEILDLNDLDQGWTFTTPMKNNRVLPDAVLLPDGTVFVSGGSSTGTADATRTPVFEAELYNPKTNQWTSLAHMHVPRLYHAAAVLLPSGEILTSGTDKLYNIFPFQHPEQRIEVFKPPYLFKGPRPVIAAVPEKVTYGQTFDVGTPDAGAVTMACFMAPSATTHSFNMQQRHIGLKMGDKTANSLTLEAPPNANIAPPGYYMLFLLNAEGVPSEAQFIQLI